MFTMEIVIEIPQDINKLCRTCMTVIKENESENVITCESDQYSYLSTMLKYVTGLNVTTTDGLPAVMCNACINKLQIAYLFKEQCENTYLNFQEIISSDEKVFGESKTVPDTNLSCTFCLHESPTSYQLSKHLIRHYRNETLSSRYLLSRADQHHTALCTEVDENTAKLIEERRYENVSGVTVKHDEIEVTPTVIEERKYENVNGVTVKHDEIEVTATLIEERKYKNVNGVSVKHDQIEVSVEDVTPQDDSERDAKTESEVVKICDLCDRIFSSDLKLSLHFVNHALLVESDTDPNIFDQYIFCTNCGQTFDDKNGLKTHIDECPADQQQQYECLKCSLTFDNELNLLKHEKFVDHNGDYFWDDEFLTKSVVKHSYCCPICTDSFPKKNDLNLHSVKHVVKKILCRLCRGLFCTQVAYNEHLRTHPNYRHVCDVCGKFLGSKHALKMHVMGVHSATKNFVCGICSKGFKTPGRLYIHKLTHKTDKKFVCSYCAYRTNNVGDFKVHNRIHTSERPYKCNFVNCTKSFKTSSHLNEHIQRHLQIKKFQCNMCDMVFGHNHTLKMHLMVHTGEKPFACEHCKARFRRKHHLKNHMRQHTNN